MTDSPSTGAPVNVPIQRKLTPLTEIEHEALVEGKMR